MSIGSAGIAFNISASKPDQDAINKLTEEIATNPDDPVLYNKRGITYLKSRGTMGFFQSNYDVLAMSDFTKAIELNPDYAVAYINRGVAIMSRVDYNAGGKTPEAEKKAIEDYSQAIKIDPTHAIAYTNRSITYNIQKLYDLSLVDSTKAIELDPKDVNSYFSKAYALKRKHQNKEAIEVLRVLRSTSPSPLYYAKAGDWIRELGGTP